MILSYRVISDGNNTVGLVGAPGAGGGLSYQPSAGQPKKLARVHWVCSGRRLNSAAPLSLNYSDRVRVRVIRAVYLRWISISLARATRRCSIRLLLLCPPDRRCFVQRVISAAQRFQLAPCWLWHLRIEQRHAIVVAFVLLPLTTHILSSYCTHHFIIKFNNAIHYSNIFHIVSIWIYKLVDV